LALTNVVACGSVPTTTGPAQPHGAVAPTAAERPGPASLSSTEQAFEGELRRDVETLAKKIGERNAAKKWELAEAADWLAAELEGVGYSLDRHGQEIDGVAVQNLAVELRGARAPSEIVIVGAHYDSASGSPGANDNASGVAATLALARRFKTATTQRTLRFVFFANEEPPYFQTANMGSLSYAKALSARGENVVAMLSLETIGCYSDAPGSQRHPDALKGRYPSVGNFVAVVGNPSSRQLVELVTDGLNTRSSVPAQGATLPESVSEAGWSDHWSFWQIRVPAVMVTDTAPFRYEHYHRPTDTPDRLDYARMARVVAGLETVVAELVGDVMAPLPNRKSKDPVLD